jgi:hypothetical protein
MESTIIEKLFEVGITGVFCAILLIYIFRLQKEHRTERKEMRDTNEKNFQTVVDVTKKNTEVVSKLQGTMESIAKTIC